MYEYPEFTTLQELALEAADRNPPSLADFVIMWKYAGDEPQNEKAKSIFIELHKKREIETKSTGLERRWTYYDERTKYLLWATLDEMMKMGYYGYKTVTGEIVIRNRQTLGDVTLEL